MHERCGDRLNYPRRAFSDGGDERDSKDFEALNSGPHLRLFRRGQTHNRGCHFSIDHPGQSQRVTRAHLNFSCSRCDNRGPYTGDGLGTRDIDRNDLVGQIGYRPDLGPNQKNGNQLLRDVWRRKRSRRFGSSRRGGLRGSRGGRIAFRFLLQCRTGRGGRQILRRWSGRDLLRRCAGIRLVRDALRRKRGRLGISRWNDFRGSGGFRVAFLFLLQCRTGRSDRQIRHRWRGCDLLRCCAGIRTRNGI